MLLNDYVGVVCGRRFSAAMKVGGGYCTKEMDEEDVQA